ncbi:hypothetical protein JTB14_027430 [Gonioctena quinquepunctata]|nr:hypothetical protein JTB14_027430 [Gonioctena quinquepunctata]
MSSSCQFTNEELKVFLRDIFIVSYNKGPVQDRLMGEKKSVTFDEVMEVTAVKSVIDPTSSNSNLEHFFKQEPELPYAFSKNRQSPRFRGRV